METKDYGPVAYKEQVKSMLSIDDFLGLSKGTTKKGIGLMGIPEEFKSFTGLFKKDYNSLIKEV